MAPTTHKDDTDARRSEEEKVVKSSFSFGGVLGGLGGLVDKLTELAEAGEKLSKSGEFSDAAGKLRGVYGINVRTALGDRGQEELKIEPFGNVGTKTAERPPEEEVREPIVDIHEEEDHILVLAELPGVDKENVSLTLSENQIDLSAKRDKMTYRKEIELPAAFTEEAMEWDCKNGILQIHLKK